MDKKHNSFVVTIEIVDLKSWNFAINYVEFMFLASRKKKVDGDTKAFQPNSNNTFSLYKNDSQTHIVIEKLVFRI